MPSSLLPPVINHTLIAVDVYAPRDSAFLHNAGTSFVIQCSSVDTTTFATWTTIASGTTVGTAAESISITVTSSFTNPLNQYHRIAFLGDSVNYVTVAQVQFLV